MFARLFRLIHHRSDELLVTAVVLVGAAVYYVPGLMPLLNSQGFLVQNAESTQVYNDVRDHFARDEPSAIILMKHKDGLEVANPSFKSAVDDVVTQIKRQDGVEADKTFYDTGAGEFVSKDKRSTFATVSIRGEIPDQEVVAVKIRDQVKNDKLEIAFAGVALINHDISEQVGKDLAQAETISFILLGILLIIVFRGLVAALLPLLLGGFTVLVAMLGLRVLAEMTTIVEYALNVIILIGLGLAVDYSLLMVSRFREELVVQKGDASEALRVTMATAGRTIFFSGLTVIISLLALLLFPLDFLHSMGMGGALAVFVAMSGALVVLPAILRLLGRRVNWLSFGSARKMDQSAADGTDYIQTESVWHRTGQFFMRFPLVTVAVTLALFAFAVTPFLRVILATPDVKVLPPTSAVRQATERLQSDFSFNDNPIQVVYTTDYDTLTRPEAIGKLYDYTRELAKQPTVRDVQSIVNLPGQSLTKEQYQQFYQRLEMQPQPVREAVARLMDGKKALVNVSFTGDTLDSATQELVRDLRNVQHPNAGVTVGGYTAQLVDLVDALRTYIPYALGLIAVTLFVLLFLMLGSVVIPLLAMVQNVLSLGVSFGALVLIFQEGFLADLLHMNVVGSVDATQPILVFAVAFGLSMDYSVFLYGRIKEEYDKSGDTNAALLAGLQKTGGIITSAAILLFVVVAAFATSRISIMQQVGVGLGLAILVDAFVVRMVLVPATVKLFGRVNWWAPKWMKRLHHKIGLSE
ncbi:MAG TPA: MMPL family transporter [Candidatus Saccharimonadales bacterium]|nr:MMPL family transporter [Candidatus Saccharimonadales bacterium]